jgi:hypothetical protein
VGGGLDLGFGGFCGGGPDLGFGGFDGGWRWVGDPIWVLGVAAAWRRGYPVGVDGLIVTVCCRGLAMVAGEGGER